MTLYVIEKQAEVELLSANIIFNLFPQKITAHHLKQAFTRSLCPTISRGLQRSAGESDNISEW